MTTTTIYTQKSRPWRSLENSIIVFLNSSNQWLDNTNDSFVSQLRSVVNTVEIFTDLNLLADFITSIQHEKVFCIVSDIEGKLIVPLLHEVSSLNSFYILSDDTMQAWIRNYRKVKGIFHDINSICNHMKNAVKEVEQNMSSISVLGDSTRMDLNQLSPSFMYSQLLKDIILNTNFTNESKSEFIEYCRTGYQNNRVALDTIEQFSKEYLGHSPVWW